MKIRTVRFYLLFSRYPLTGSTTMSKHTEIITRVSQTATCSSVIYVNRVYVCLCIFRKINWPYAPNHNHFAILLSCEDELSLCETKFRRKNNSFYENLDSKMSSTLCSQMIFGLALILFDIYFILYIQAVYLFQKIPEYVAKDTYIFINQEFRQIHLLY